jgi:hypothetical protein
MLAEYAAEEELGTSVAEHILWLLDTSELRQKDLVPYAIVITDHCDVIWAA